MKLEEEEYLNFNDIDGDELGTTVAGDGDGDLEAVDGGEDNNNSFFENNNNNNISSANDETTVNSNIDDNVKAHAWPITYGVSMDMLSTSPSIGFLSWQGSNFLANKASQASTALPLYSSLSRPLIDDTSSDNKEPPPLTPTPSSPKLTGFSNRRFSSHRIISANPQCSTAQSVFNGVNVICGIGILTTPYAIMQGGWLGLSQMGIFGVMAYYTAILLMRCLESNESIKTYPDIGQAAFGSTGRINVSVVLYFELFGTCVEFIIMMSDNLSMLFPNASLCLFGTRLATRQLFSILSSLLVLPSVWLKDLSLLSYFSVGGVAASVLIGVCLLWVGLVDNIGFHSAGSAINMAGLYATIGIYAYAFAGHSVFPNVYTSMKEPSRFPLVLIVSFISCLLISVGVGACGYLMFGDSIESQLTLSMPKQLVASKIAVLTMVVIPLTKYALTITPVAMSVEELLPLTLRKSHSVSIIVRSLLVFSTLIVALTVPFFASVMALLGSVCSMLVSFIFPCACYLSMFKGRLTKIQIASCVTIIIFSILCGYLGTYSAIADLLTQQKIVRD